ncbi:unnamed protein product, partial [Symbiodinium sp. CCMP2456]
SIGSAGARLQARAAERLSGRFPDSPDRCRPRRDDGGAAAQHGRRRRHCRACSAGRWGGWQRPGRRRAAARQQKGTGLLQCCSWMALREVCDAERLHCDPRRAHGANSATLSDSPRRRQD